jgi:hypothetical protein
VGEMRGVACGGDEGCSCGLDEGCSCEGDVYIAVVGAGGGV